MAFAYILGKLTEEQEITLRWLSNHGYDGGIYDASSIDDDGIWGIEEEHKAWEVADTIREDEVAFMTCCGDQELINMCSELEMEIV